MPSKRPYPESYDSIESPLLRGVLIVFVVGSAITIAGFLVIYCIGL